MSLSAKIVRGQISRMKPLLRSCSLETIRMGQNKIGELMETKCRKQVVIREHPFARFRRAHCGKKTAPD